METENAENIKNDLRKEISEIYTPLSVAKEEIWRRWNDKELKKKVEDFLGEKKPTFFKDAPKAYLVRQITSPDIEFFLFLDLIKMIELEPLFVEFCNDKFASSNSNKYYRCNLYFYNGQGKKYGNKIVSKKIIDFDKYDGKKFEEIKTKWQEPLINFHHKLIEKEYPHYLNNIVDVSNWIEDNGKKASEFYIKYLAWFICHGVLFENFMVNDEEILFTKNIVLPSIKKLENKFNVKPLIIPIIPIEDEEDTYWRCYPEKIGNIILENIK